jgi:hypothetical protein
MPRHQSNRGNFIGRSAGTAATSVYWPLAARAQQSAMPIVGFLGGSSPSFQPDRRFPPSPQANWFRR